MSKPPIKSPQTVSGITLDPRTLERVIPESKRPDGSIRKELKVRPGFTPQEDVSRFRGSRQQQLDRNALPKGHILGWVAPSSETKKSSSASSGDKPLSKSAAKNAKRKAKKQSEKEQIIKDNWEDDDNNDSDTQAATKETHKSDASNNAVLNSKEKSGLSSSAQGAVDTKLLTDELQKLELQE